jgi:hypothetical protein
MGKIHRLLVAAFTAVAVLQPAAAPAAPDRPAATTGCTVADFPAGNVMARAAASRGCRSAGNRALADTDESAIVVPGAIRAEATATITIVSVVDPPTPFTSPVTVTATGPHGDATISNPVVTDPTHVTATIVTPAVEEFLDVVVTNMASGFTYAAKIDVRNATGEFHPVTPTRVFDTRFNTPTVTTTVTGPPGRLAANRSVEAAIAGINGLPPTGIDAVAVNITAVDPAADGFLTAWPAQTPRPDASSINYARGRTVANLVTVAVGPDGGLDLAASTATDVILDVVGWYATPPPVLPDKSAVASAYLPLTPERRTDTRFPMTNPVNASKFIVNGSPVNGPLHAGETRTLALDAFAQEFEAVDAVALNVTVSGPTAPGFLTIWPADQSRPNASSVNFGVGDAIPNMVIVPISSLHQLNFFNSAGNTDVIVDLVGVYETMFFGGLIFESTAPTRVIDSRLGTGLAARPLTANQTVTVTLSGTALVPNGADAVVMNAVIADSATPTGFVTVYSADDTQPNVSNLNVQIGRAAANQVMAPLLLEEDAAINIFNANGPANIIADVTGFFF